MQTNNTNHSQKNFIARLLAVFVFITTLTFAFVAFPTSASREKAKSKNDKASSVRQIVFQFASSQFLPFEIRKAQPHSANGSLEMKVVTADLEKPQQISYYLPANNMLLSSGQPGKLSFFSANKTENYLFANEKSIKLYCLTTVRDAKGKFTVSDVFVGLDKGRILHISNNNTKIKLTEENGAVDGGLVVDETKAFGGDLIAVIGKGRIWRVDSSGTATLLSDLNTSLKGVAIIPNDVGRYGNFAGKIIVGATEQRGIFIIDSDGQSTFYPLNIKPNDIDLIQENENLFAVSTNENKLFEVDKENFANITGDILITSADSKELFSLHLNSYGFQLSSFTLNEESDQVAFAPISLSSNAAACVTSISQVENVFQWIGGEGSFDVIAPSNCNWTASSNASWLAIKSGQSGTGNGTVIYSVSKNVENFLREANITVDMLTHRVRQSRKAQLQCSFGLDPSNPNIPAIGGNGTINVTGSDECAWQAVSDSPWLTITGNSFGRGNGSISFTVPTNFGGEARQGKIIFGVNGGAATVTQSPNLAPVVNAGADQTIALPNTAQLSGSASDDGIGNPVTVSWSKLSGPETVLFSNANNTSGNAIFNKEGVYVLRLTASDGYLTSFDDVQITVNPDPVPPPPDPATTAPPINPTVATNPFDATKFLYTGPNAIQTGVTPGTIKEDRVAIFRGRVVSKSGQPISKVKITIQDHPELGQTLSRTDGMFDIVVNGGGELSVKYEKLGFITVQREENAGWQDYEATEDVVMIPYDGNVTFIDLNSIAPIQIVQGGVITDSSGTRRSRLFFKQGTTATMRLPNGSTQPLTTMNVRSSEFTVGANGPETMPADLPPLSAYTYAAAYTVDEAVAVGATEVTFNQPVVQYNENFLNFPVGTNIPSGSLDEITGMWMPSANGRVVKILSITSGVANLDLNGSGNPATDPEYAALGINVAERQQLATLYTVNQSLWRVPVIHFSSWDSNWPFGPPPDAQPPGGDPPMCDT